MKPSRNSFGDFLSSSAVPHSRKPKRSAIPVSISALTCSKDYLRSSIRIWYSTSNNHTMNLVSRCCRRFGNTRASVWPRVETSPVRRAHAAYCVVLAEEGNPELTAEARDLWLIRCELEIDNLRSALDWLFEARDLIGDCGSAWRCSVSGHPRAPDRGSHTARSYTDSRRRQIFETACEVVHLPRRVVHRSRRFQRSRSFPRPESSALQRLEDLRGLRHL